MDNIVGPPVRGNHLKYRDSDIAELLSRLNAGNSILLIGLRRIGKSSVMQAIKDRAPDHWIVSYNDMESKKLPADIFTAFLHTFPQNHRKELQTYWINLKAIPGKVLDQVTSFIKSIGINQIGVEMEFNKSIIEYWKPLTDGIEKIISRINEPIVMILDEFPIYIEMMLRSGCPSDIVQRILGLLKSWRGTYHHFRMVVGGSVSMDRILSKNNIHAATINDFSRYFLPPLELNQASNFLKELAASYQLTWFKGDLIEKTLDLIGDYYPFFLQSFFQELRTKSNLSLPDIEEIFENRFIPSIQKGFFDQYRNRLENNYQVDDRKYAYRILDFISRQENYTASYSSIKAELENENAGKFELDSLLYELVGDEFISCNTRTFEYTFTTKLVAKWWYIHRGRSGERK